MSDDQRIALGQTDIVLGQPVSDPHDGLVLGEPVLDDAQPPIANGQPGAIRALDLPNANRDPHVQGDGPAAGNGHRHHPEALAVPHPLPAADANEGSGDDDRDIAPPSVEAPLIDETAQEAAVEPANYVDEDTQESALNREEEMEEEPCFERCDRVTPNRGFGVGKPLIVAGMVIAVVGVVVAGIRKA